jgi:hypothetical protein
MRTYFLVERDTQGFTWLDVFCPWGFVFALNFMHLHKMGGKE